MPTKDEILSEIRRVAQERGDRMGLVSFLKTTGISKNEIFGKHWASWSEALSDAGLATTGFCRSRTDENVVLEAIACLIERLKKWPTENELVLERQYDPSFPCLNVIRRLRRSGELPRRLRSHCAKRPDLGDAAMIAAHQLTFGSSHLAASGRAPFRGYVYMMRSGQHYEIDHPALPIHRYREVRSDLPESRRLIHSIETANPPRVKAYWYCRFESKRVHNTTFFQLNAGDISAFKLRKRQ